MTAVGFEPTQLSLVELESTPLDHSGKLSCTSALPFLQSEVLQKPFLGKLAEARVNSWRVLHQAGVRRKQSLAGGQ